ncbi:glycoside hydrolase family 13 protein [Xylanimonas ulmi]|uniref:Alpha-glucosidase n=1 Tax=Xylanimonas ulmi TaxID=228973 RepID=A0A4Q7LZU5_9MICO|nr:glycoside hydrolase family 13 protein [Xylanibacterium ulmi]RZS59802.1 alpha-glucosidase [Xylanibacterium ulmi]
MTVTPSSPARAAWWRQAVVYQVYPRSFADGNGDGVGDFAGILGRIGHLEALGVDAVWISPFYPSALVDGGYDVDDYTDIDPRIGTLEQFDLLVHGLHERGIRLIIDLVPNHSSNRHARFQAALAAGPGSPERDWYVFRDGRGEHGELPPADWRSLMGEPAWTRVPDGQWYLHLFTSEQPDFNWSNPAVRDFFTQVLRFWGDRGVDGFRVDVANGLTKRLDADLPNQEQLDDASAHAVGDHPLWDRDDVQSVYRQWRRVFDEYDPPLMAVAEAWVSADRRLRYTAPGSLDQAFGFDLLRAPWDASAFRRVIAESYDLADRSGAPPTWVLSSHDVVRHATRYGLVGAGDENDWLRSRGAQPIEDREVGLRRARAATLLALALPGSAYLYQGEELGLPEVMVPDDQRQDPVFWRKDGLEVGRDGCRVPLPWTTDGTSFGFGAGGAHLPQPSWFGEYAVDGQERDPASTLTLYRRALRLRRVLQVAESMRLLDLGNGVVGFERPGGWISVTNFDEAPVPLPRGEVVLASDAEAVRAGLLGPNATVWLTQNGVQAAAASRVVGGDPS